MAKAFDLLQRKSRVSFEELLAHSFDIPVYDPLIHNPKIYNLMARMKKHLELSDEQVEDIRKIRQEGGSREDVRAVLTPEQQRKSDDARKNRQGKHTPPAEQ